jgi:hypothetical protein
LNSIHCRRRRRFARRLLQTVGPSWRTSVAGGINDVVESAPILRPLLRSTCHLIGELNPSVRHHEEHSFTRIALCFAGRLHALSGMVLIFSRRTHGLRALKICHRVRRLLPKERLTKGESFKATRWRASGSGRFRHQGTKSKSLYPRHGNHFDDLVSKLRIQSRWPAAGRLSSPLWTRKHSSVTPAARSAKCHSLFLVRLFSSRGLPLGAKGERD